MVCNKNWGNCDNNPTNGCETNLLTNAKHCGNCGHVCDANQGLICTNGSCACSAKLTDCKGVCVDTASDAKNCGACDKVCATGWSCCAGVCLDTRSDNANCGACNKVCKTTEFCCKSVCESYIGSAGVPLISTGPCNTLRYGRYANHGQTNTVHILPDFSYAGYRGGGVAIPSAPVRETLSPVTNPTDDRTRIQAAIDKVSGFKPDANGLRGAVLLKKGTYRVGDTLRIKDSGVILQGEGQGSNGTVIIATKKAQHDLIAVEGMGSGFGEVKDSRVNITSSYLPVGSRTITVSSAQGFKIGDAIVVERTPNQSWIDDLKMAQYGWTTTGYRISFERTIADIKGNDLIIDIPLVDTIENKYGGGAVYRSAISGRISQCGIENIRLSSVYSSNTDEEHAWKAIKMRRVENSWVRNVTGLHFGYAIVSIEGESRFNTVEDTAILDPKSQITGSRRYPFNVSGMSMGNLFQRCYSQYGRHNFVSGARVPGPNVWLDCLVVNSHSDDGPHHRWATGLLFDNTKGRDLNVQNRGPSGTGHGWSGAQTLFWNAEAVNIVCDTPKGAMNWAIGCKGTKRSGTMVSPKEPFGWWESHEKVVSPRSLYLAQLAIRKGSTAVSQIAHPGQLNGRIWKHLENWAGQGSILDYLPDPTCARGIRSGTVCCAPSCGTCGGTGCSSRPGGSQACCTTQISASGRKCSEEPAPCVM
jgi:hypothetical protein